MKLNTDYTYIIDNTLSGNNKFLIEFTFFTSTNSTTNILTLNFEDSLSVPAIKFASVDKK